MRTKDKNMEIKILGTGCAKCKKLEELTIKAVGELGLNTVVEKVEDIQKIMEYGIMRTPGLILNGKIVLSGQILGVAGIKELIANNQ